MILPKGTIDFSKQAGEGIMDEIIEMIDSENRTGYLLVIGDIEDIQGEKQEITAQLLFEDGVPKLCEAVVNNQSHKGSSGLYPTMKAMEQPQNTIEMHSKIDVGPPMAFFKECIFSKEEMDLDSFRKEMENEKKERKKREEELKRKREEEERIKKEVDEWISSGYIIADYPDIMEEEHDEIIKWYKEFSTNIEEARSIMEWAGTVDEIEVADERDSLLKKAKDPSSMDSMRSAAKDLKAKISDISDKRKEMEKWVNLWKDEGYNTERIEKTLKSDLNTAWNNLTKFMDDIQSLKDHRAELEEIREKDPEDHFGPEIREIDFLLNDPMELETIEDLLGKLKTTIEEEKNEKDRLMEEAKPWEDRGFDLSSLSGRTGERLEAFRKDQKSFLDNIGRIEQIRNELSSLDRRDIPEMIDKLEGSMNDPFKLPNFEEELEDIKSRIDVFATKRNAIMDEIKKLEDEGFVTVTLREKENVPVEELTALFEDFRSRVSELKDLRSRISEMDHRWLENEFKEIESLLMDISRIDEVRSGMKELQERIDRREAERERIKEQMERWRSEGFDVSRLEEVIEEDETTFKAVFSDLEERINRAKELISDLEGLNVKFFPREAKEIESRLHDPEIVDRASKELEALKERIGKDWDIRNRLHGRIDELKGKGWDVTGLEAILDSSPDMITDKVKSLEDDLKELNEALEDIDSWDKLESSLLSEGISELREELHRIREKDSALDHYRDLKQKIEQNKEKRSRIADRIKEWKESDFITKNAEDKLNGHIDELNDAFEDLKGKMEKLTRLTDTFDSLKIDHFRAEAEEIEFKLNDPYHVDQIQKKIEQLSGKIDADEERRSQFMDRIDDYVKEGFMGANKLKDFMEEDISIVELEFKNFEKEVQLFRKYMKSTGFTFTREKEEEITGSKQDYSEDEGTKREEEKEEEETAGKEETGGDEKETGSADDRSKTDMTFSNFVVGTSNEIAHKAAMNVADDPGNAYNPLLILAEEGMGKTHLLHAIEERIRENDPENEILHLSGEEFLERLKDHKENGRMEDFRELFRNADTMILDDLDQLKENEMGQDVFINILNGMLDKRKQVIMSSKRDIKSISKIAEQIRARLDEGVSVDLDAPTEDLKTNFVERYRENDLTDEIRDYLATAVLGNMELLMKSVKRINQEVGSDGARSLEKAKEIVDEITGEPGHRKLTEALADTLNNMKSSDSNDEMVVCTNCDKEIPADSTKCPHCGALFEDVEMKECPVCKELVEIEAVSCPNCGMDF